VWGESVHATLALFQEEVWKDKEVFEVDNCLDVTSSVSRLALPFHLTISVGSLETKIVEFNGLQCGK
jgi:hypothetical protein